MERALQAFSILTMVSVGLAGCLGGTGAGGTDVGDVPDADIPTRGIVHGPGGTPAVGDVLDGPVPVGAGQLTGFPAFEPTIGVTSDGTLFMSNWGGGLGTDWTSVVRSQDRGQTWEDVTPSIGPVSSPPQSNDPYVYVDETTDRVYNLDMQGLECNWIQWSDDGGATWTTNPVGCGATPLLDHPTIFAGPPTTLETVGYDNVVHLCVNRVYDSACSVSLDGGRTFTPFTTVFPGANEDGFCGGLHAHGTTGPDGTAYLPKGQCGVPSIAISQDDGLTWETVAITEEVQVKGHEVAIDTDAAGNVYAFWISPDREPYLAYSTDEGRSWSDPVMVAPPGVPTTDFPTVAAGAEGQVAVAYVGTTTDKRYSEMDGDDTWNAYLTISDDVLSGDPAFATVTVNDPADPIARGVCGNSRCYAEEGGALGDFIDVVIDRDGRPWAAFVDACTQECVDDPSAGRDHGVGLVGTLRQGPSLVGSGTLPGLGW